MVHSHIQKSLCNSSWKKLKVESWKRCFVNLNDKTKKRRGVFCHSEWENTFFHEKVFYQYQLQNQKEGGGVICHSDWEKHLIPSEWQKTPLPLFLHFVLGLFSLTFWWWQKTPLFLQFIFRLFSLTFDDDKRPPPSFCSLYLGFSVSPLMMTKDPPPPLFAVCVWAFQCHLWWWQKTPPTLFSYCICECTILVVLVVNG